MSNELMLDVGQANELKLALRAAGFTPELVKRMCEAKTKLAGFREVLLSESKIVPMEHVIDGNADPRIPKDCGVVSHVKLGRIVWDNAMIWGRELFDLLFLFRAEKQRVYEPMVGTTLYHTDLKSKRVANANVLDYLLAHPSAIPDTWKWGKNRRGRRVFFWGTIFSDAHGDQFVRYLFWNAAHSKWDTNIQYTAGVWSENDYALTIPDEAL